MIEYKFNEGDLIQEFKKYVDKTYDQHYATDKYQATDIILDSGHGEGFCLGNVIKYAKRYGKKGDNSTARQDLMKIMHYALIQLFNHDEQQSKNFTIDLENVCYTPYDDEEEVYLDGIRLGPTPEFSMNIDMFPDDYISVNPNGRLNDATPEEWDKATKKRKTDV